ncbi:MAG: class I SAM-dependent methyltransferase [Huintestinicola sp.]|uniref:class I SAM-dependent methyltransferase n=1 Tax=Huintestinicola sp. TaxID=2981661 RepID=UPI003EFD4206
MKMETRIKNKITEISYDETKEFFRKRADKYDPQKPYCVTMYQDNHSELVVERNRREVEILYPQLGISPESRVLDIACGIGRWADAIKEEISCYLGIDFSEELIGIAKSRCSRPGFSFVAGDLKNVASICSDKKYDTILMIGILQYLNDSDIAGILEGIISCCDDTATVCIREPIAEEGRLTLNHFYSEELKDNYNAIYRSNSELTAIFEQTFFKHGFSVKKQAYLFEEANLNNRKETSQYYYILTR